MMRFHYYLPFVLAGLFFLSCEKDKSTDQTTDYDIVPQGKFVDIEDIVISPIDSIEEIIQGDIQCNIPSPADSVLIVAFDINEDGTNVLRLNIPMAIKI